VAEYYDAENEHHAMLREDVPFFLGHLPRRKRQTILELAVGTGRAAIPLAEAGHRVVGFDYAEDMLAIARRKRDAVGLTDRQLTLLHGDATRLDLRRRFDWVCIFFNTFLAFPSLKEQDAVLQVVRRHMKKKARFWLDIFQPNLPLLAQDVTKNLEPVAFHVPRYDRAVFKTTEVRRDPARQLQQVTFHYTWFDKKGGEHHERTRFDMTFIFPRELQMLLERNGLAIEHLYGNYDGSALNADSPRIIAVCRLL
jgi:ubiquinone/menaquinone biosynthesis C-methylase UbiE